MGFPGDAVVAGPSGTVTVIDRDNPTARLMEFAKINGQRVALTDNKIIEDNLSEKTKGAVICMEDLVHQIYTTGPYFKEVTKFLWPFKMNNPCGGLSRIRHHFVEGGDAGNREEYINELVSKML